MRIKLLTMLVSVLMAGPMLAQNPSFSPNDEQILTITEQRSLLEPRVFEDSQQNVVADMTMNTNQRNYTVSSLKKISELDGAPIRTLANGDVYTIEGKYTLTISDTFSGSQTGKKYDIDAEIYYDSSKRSYILKETNSSWFTVKEVPFTFSNNTMTFKNERLGTVVNPSYYCQFAPVYYPGGPNITLYTTMDVTFNASTGVFTFPTNTGFGWGGWTNSSYSGAMAGWFAVFGITQGVHEPMAADPELNVPAYVMVGIDEDVDLASCFDGVEVTGWTTSDGEVASVSAGVVTGLKYGQATVTATRSQNGVWGAVKVLVCPQVTVLYPEGIETSHLVGYGSPVDILLAPADGWRVCTASVEGRDITSQIDGTGRLLSDMAVNRDTLVNIVTAKTSNPQWADNIRIIVDGRKVTVNGTGVNDNINITDYRNNKCVYDWTHPEIPFSEGGVFNVTVTDAATGTPACFRMVLQ